ncbi:MAG: molybdenum cofactor biosynthesis protein [Solirubrobacteraceae bacterium]
MHVQVRLFAALRERAGAERIELELPPGARVADALSELRWLTGDVPVVMAINRQYADGEAQLHADDELALIPPVSGGAAPPANMLHVRVHHQPLALDPLIVRVRDPRAGAVVTFLGMTREVEQLDYEAYIEMAEAKIAEIVAGAVSRHGLCAAAVEHRIGIVPLSEPSIAIAASAPHRAEAFAGAREILDLVKAQAPIWKKEEGAWVKGSIPGPT